MIAFEETNDIYDSEMVTRAHVDIPVVFVNWKHEICISFVYEEYVLDIFTFCVHKRLIREELGLKKRNYPCEKGNRSVL